MLHSLLGVCARALSLEGSMYNAASSTRTKLPELSACTLSSKSVLEWGGARALPLEVPHSCHSCLGVVPGLSPWRCPTALFGGVARALSLVLQLQRRTSPGGAWAVSLEVPVGNEPTLSAPWTGCVEKFRLQHKRRFLLHTALISSIVSAPGSSRPCTLTLRQSRKPYAWLC